MKTLDKIYQAKSIEKDKYNFWLENNLFTSTDNNQKRFSMILPPPNVTGVLHLGHALDVSIQDLIIRFKKLNGFNVCWVPGTDHAGIATQTKFEAFLKNEKKQKRTDFTRKQFIEELWAWAQIQSNTIHEQWKKMGLSLDYSKEKFTMDSDVNEIVNKVFVDLYNQGLIYQGEKLVNWDIKLQTAISDIEVIHKETKAKLYYIKYYLDKSFKDYLIVATTRPETMFGDTCLFVNPNDERYKKFINKKAYNPANGQWIDILSDDYIDIEFGTGVMKCTPAHDFNDYELAKKHNLPLINIMNNDGTMNDKANKYEKLDRIKCRELLVEDLLKNNFIDHIDENYNNQIGYSERTNEIVEPLLSKQWFLKMKPLADKVIASQKINQKNKTTNFLPKRFEKNLNFWLENIQDWCISRQLWWGHQLPIWYNNNSNEIYVNTTPPKDIENWTRESDVLDTWFSSGLWPLVCFGWKTNETLFKQFYPTDMLVTGYDILTFWVSRMMMLATHFTDQTPFENVYIHGLIRDAQGRKMSKSLGNGVDPMQVIDEYGADTLRLFLTSSSTIGEDLRYYPEKLKMNWAFLNKLWNSVRFIFSNFETFNFIPTNNINNIDLQNHLIKWILNKFNYALNQITNAMNDYNFVVSTKYLIDFIYEDFCSNFIELAKISLKQNKNVNDILETMNYILKNVLILLHSQCPFITEEIYQCLHKKQKSIMLESWPTAIKNINNNNKQIDWTIQIINVIRRIRKDYNINHNQALEINIISKNNLDINVNEINHYINNIINTSIVSIKKECDLNKNYLLELLNDFSLEIIFEKNKDEEIEKLKKLVDHLQKEIARSTQILANKNFVDKAPKEKVAQEQEKLNKYQEQLKTTLENLKKYE